MAWGAPGRGRARRSARWSSAGRPLVVVVGPGQGAAPRCPSPLWRPSPLPPRPDHPLHPTHTQKIDRLWAMDWGQAAPGRLRGGPVGPPRTHAALGCPGQGPLPAGATAMAGPRSPSKQVRRPADGPKAPSARLRSPSPRRLPQPLHRQTVFQQAPQAPPGSRRPTPPHHPHSPAPTTGSNVLRNTLCLCLHHLGIARTT